MSLRVLSYNIHKGFNSSGREYVLDRIKASIEKVRADVVLLQEVLGDHEGHRSRIPTWPRSSQFEHLADRLWPHFAYGKNAAYAEGHHGNAILSKYPIASWENEDVSLSSIERRGMLHAKVRIPGREGSLHLLCVHLGLFEHHRKAQVQKICDRILGLVPAADPLVLGGDFNDWRGRASAPLREKAGLKEAFQEAEGRHAATYPSRWPILRLDRLYFKGLQLSSARLMSGSTWSPLSDHLPILAELRLP